MQRWRGWLAVLWVLFAAVAIASGWIAVRMVGGAVTPNALPVLTTSEVSKGLATATPAPEASREHQSGTPSGSPTGPSSPGGKPTTRSGVITRTLSSPGGWAIAQCNGSQAQINAVSPTPGFRQDEVNRGPATEVEVRFVSASAEVTLRIECVDGSPQGAVETDQGSGDDD